jgi:rRNA maturation endonuclease Nob1
MEYVLDSGIFMNQNKVPEIDGECFISQATIDEIRSVSSSHLLDIFLANHRVNIVDPASKYLEQIKRVAIKMGQNRLSDVDTEVLALALMMSESREITLLTDDYGLRNVAHQLNLNSKGVKSKGGREKRRYAYRCNGCQYVYNKIVDDCDICGTTKFDRLRK